jgi:hypothetical protein
MSLPDSINEIAHSMRCLVPPWLPAYDHVAYATKVDAECGYGSETMAAAEFITRMLEETVSFVQLCAAFVPLTETTNRQYFCVRSDKTEIDNLLAQNASNACPTYTGLLALFVEQGILKRPAPEAGSDRY